MTERDEIKTMYNSAKCLNQDENGNLSMQDCNGGKFGKGAMGTKHLRILVEVYN